MQEGSVLIESVLPYLRRMGFGAIVPEQSFGVGSRRVRADAIVYGIGERPVAIVEIKSRLDPPVDYYHAAVQQAYKIALVAETPYFLVTNGEEFHWFKVDWDNGRAEPSEPPIESSPAQQRTRPFRDEAEFRQVLWAIVSILRGQISASEYPAVLTVLLEAKLRDEVRVRSGESSQFYALPGEDPGTVAHRLEALIEGQAIERGRVTDKELAQAVELLQSFSMLDTSSQVLIDVHNELVRRSLDPEVGVSLTPSWIADFVIELLDPRRDERILDPACGSGSFLLAATNYLRINGEEPVTSTDNLFGVDINEQIVKVAELNMMLAGGARAKIHVADSLDQSELDQIGIRQSTFDIVVTNPPFGIKIQEEQTRLLQLGKFRVRSEAIFLELSLALLRDGGRAAILVPNSLLVQGGSSEQVRSWIMENARLDAIIELPNPSAIFGSGINTSILILTKGSPQRAPVFMSRVGELGSDLSEQGRTENNLGAIVSDFHHFLEGGRDFETGWTVNDTQNLIRRMDVASNDPFFRSIHDRFADLPYEVLSLGRVADLRKGFHRPYAEVGEVPVVTARDIASGQIKMERPRYAVPSEVRVLLQAGDLLVSEFRSSSPPVLVEETDLPATIGNGVFLIRLTEPSLSGEFLRILFTTDLVTRQIELLSAGGVPRLRLQDLQQLLIPVPDEDTQNEVLKTLTEIRDLRKRATDLEKYLAARLMLPDSESDRT